MVNAIAQDQGRDDFARKRDGLHCGIRNCCVPYFDRDNSTTPCGVLFVQSLVTVVNDEMEQKLLKYPTPDVSALKMEDYLSVQELGVLFDCFEPESDMWMRVSTALSVLTAPSDENNNNTQTQADNAEQTEADEGGALVSRAM